MAKESMKAREVKRVKLANRYAHKREEIAAKLKSGEIDHEEAWVALSKLPRNSNPIRQHNRCNLLALVCIAVCEFHAFYLACLH